MTLRTKVGRQAICASTSSVVGPVDVACAASGPAGTAATSGAVEHRALVLAPRPAKPEEAGA